MVLYDRAVLASIARLVTAVRTSFFPDMTYHSFSLVISAYYEIMLGFLIFCIPMVPRVLTQGTLISKALASLGLRPCLISRRSGADKKTVQTNSPAIPGRSYRRIGEDEIALGYLGNSSVGIDGSLGQTSYARGGLPHPEVREGGIIRTTLVEVHEQIKHDNTMTDKPVF